MIRVKYCFKGKQFDTYEAAEKAEQLYYEQQRKNEELSNDMIDVIIQSLSNQFNAELYADRKGNGMNVVVKQGENIFSIDIAAKLVNRTNENYAAFKFTPETE